MGLKYTAETIGELRKALAKHTGRCTISRHHR